MVRRVWGGGAFYRIVGTIHLYTLRYKKNSCNSNYVCSGSWLDEMERKGSSVYRRRIFPAYQHLGSALFPTVCACACALTVGEKIGHRLQEGRATVHRSHRSHSSPHIPACDQPNHAFFFVTRSIDRRWSRALRAAENERRAHRTTNLCCHGAARLTCAHHAAVGRKQKQCSWPVSASLVSYSPLLCFALPWSGNRMVGRLMARVKLGWQILLELSDSDAAQQSSIDRVSSFRLLFVMELVS